MVIYDHLRVRGFNAHNLGMEILDMVASAAGSMQDFMKQLQTTRVVSCTEAAWRLAGLSLAGWNAVFSAGLALLAGLAAWRDRG